MTSDLEPDKALELARAAAEAVGLSPEGAAITRRSTSVMVELPDARVVARVESRDRIGAAERQVRVARLLEARDLPAARLVFPAAQPFVREDGAVTLWRRLDIREGEPTPRDLGRMARQLHEATREPALPAGIPAVNPIFTTSEDLVRAAAILPSTKLGVWPTAGSRARWPMRPRCASPA